jgi:CheY-like chemotaxis protein
MKIIICDDNVKRREKLIAFVQRSGSKFTVAEAESTDEVRRLLTNGYYDALVIDIVLPKRKDESPQAHNGIQLLNQICNGRKLHKPERIIAITGYLDDINSFRKLFSDFGVAVLEAREYDSGWEQVVLNGITYTADSQLARSSPNLLDVVSIHGIRTYGEWQNKLRSLISSSAPGIRYHTHKYGYFSVIAFMVPALRDVEVQRFVSHLGGLFNQARDRNFVIFSHSFGTFIAAKALEELCRQGYRNVRRLVLSGSVLPSDYDWRYLISCDVEIINDCAQDDLVLWASEALILQTGMAGKCGFFGIENAKLTNRFIRGGHSDYFTVEGYMAEHWIPLLDGNKVAACFDLRAQRSVLYESAEGVVKALGRVKALVYAFAFIILLLIVIRYFS